MKLPQNGLGGNLSNVTWQINNLIDRQIDNRVDYILLAPEDIQAKMLFRIDPFDRFGLIEP
jgi:hypothetical protein